MGHLLNKDFGGQGTQMYNLAPFSSRMNALHKTEVEHPLRQFIKVDEQRRVIDYKVKANYGAPAAMERDAKVRFDAFLGFSPNEALAAWKALGLITAADVNTLTGLNLLTDDRPLQNRTTWQVLVGQQRQDVEAYTRAHFPESIDCTARLYELSGPGTWNKSQKLSHRITHVP
jgi:hypothetical protein